MNILFAIGTCILMHGTEYKINDIGNGTYVLAQTVTVFEEQRTYREHWKQSYINKVSKPTKCIKK